MASLVPSTTKKHRPGKTHQLQRKDLKKILKEKRARLIVKNLPFKATEKQIRDFFGKYGSITNVELLKRADGKLVGCAFVQFALVQFAKQARHYTNGQLFMDRTLQVDFVKAKDQFLKEKQVKNEVKEDPDEAVKKEDVIEEEEQESKDEEDTNSELSEENQSVSSEISAAQGKKRFESHDVSEGKTVFIKNLPFEATNEDVKQCMSQFGPIYYALVCRDKYTDHSKGTAFIKFVNKEDAQKALDAGTELKILDNILDCHPAIDKKELTSKKSTKTSKDSRNLFLVREGVILAGTPAAEGVSASDMAKRLQIEQYKTQRLRDLNTFVSRERLVIYNLPMTWDDKKLKMLLQKHGGNGAIIKEARVMRNLQKLDSNGVGESKEFGFVTFSRHEHALAALRSLNNNPNIFSTKKRPIVTFSIESKTALKAKLKRLEKSKTNASKRPEKNNDLREEQSVPELKTYSGIAAERGTIVKRKNKHKLQEQAKLHMENLKKEKKKSKLAKKPLAERKKDFIKQPKQKINKKKQQDDFTKLVNKYKKSLIAADDAPAKKTKWFNTV